MAEVAGGVLERTRTEESEFVQPLVLGERLKAIRLSNSLTLADVSEMTGVARSTLSKIENQQLSPTFQVVQKLVEGLAIDIPQLFRAAPASIDALNVALSNTVPVPTYASGNACLICLIASTATGVRRVISNARKPPLYNAFASGTASSRLLITTTGTTGAA